MATWEAIFARCLVRATPMEIGSPSSSRTRARTRAAMSAGAPKSCIEPETSANASSIEMRSMSGVKSASTAIAASPRRWYSLKWPPVKMRPGQSSRACRPGMPLLTPNARAS